MNSDQLQRLVSDHLGACTWDMDLERNEIHYSDEFFALIGYAPGEVRLDRDWVANNIHPEELAAWREAFLRSIKGQSRYFDCELRFRHKLGHYIWIQTRGTVVERNPDGRALRIDGLVFDISERMAGKESESRYRLFLDNIPVAISLKDRDGRYLYINRQFEEWLGRPSYQIHGMKADEIFDTREGELDLLRQHEERVWQSGEVVSMERDFPRTPDGRERKALITKFPVFDQAGNVLAIGTTNTDVTDRVEAREALERSERRYRTLFESAPVVLAESDWTSARNLVETLQQQGVQDLRRHLLDHPELLTRQDEAMRVLTVNSEAVRVFDAGSAAALIEYAEGALDDEQRQSLIEEIVNFAGGDRRSITRSGHSRLDGSSFPVIRVAERYAAADDDWSQVLISVRDTSAEEAVRMSEIRYRRLFETAPVALFESDWSPGKRLVDELRAQGIEDIEQYLLDRPHLLARRDQALRHVNCNREALHMYRVDSQELLFDFMQGEMTTEQRHTIVRALATFAAGNRRSSQRSVSRRGDGEPFHLLRDSELISSDREDWSRVLTSIRDLSPDVEFAQRLQRYQEDLRTLAGQISLAEESERRRISSELHDGTIQNLVLARIHLETLRRSLASQGAERLADEINDLLQRSLEETRSLIFEISPPVLYELGLESAVEWLADHYRQRAGLEIVVISDDRRATLSDELRIVLFQASRELLINVIKHAQASRVTITLQHAVDWIEVIIEDDGRGFDQDTVASQPASKGGFGLFSIRERLKLLGAELEISSSPAGSRMRIHAPT